MSLRATLDRAYGGVRSAADALVETGREWIADKTSTYAATFRSASCWRWRRW